MKQKPEISLDKYKCVKCHNLFYLTTEELGHDGPYCGECSSIGHQLPPQTGRFKIEVDDQLSYDNDPGLQFAIYKKICFMWLKIYTSSTKSRNEMKRIFANIVMKHYHNREASITEKLELYACYTAMRNNNHQVVEEDLQDDIQIEEDIRVEASQTTMERFKSFALDQKGGSFSTPKKIEIGNSIIDCMEL